MAAQRPCRKPWGLKIKFFCIVRIIFKIESACSLNAIRVRRASDLRLIQGFSFEFKKTQNFFGNLKLRLKHILSARI